MALEADLAPGYHDADRASALGRSSPLPLVPKADALATAPSALHDCDMADDCRLEHLATQPYLRGAAFVRKPYRAHREGWDHDHCAGCWVTFAEPGSGVEGAISDGFATTSAYVHGAEYEWICPSCFGLFGAAMGWVDVTTRK